jgi:hypothetical protein
MELKPWPTLQEKKESPMKEVVSRLFADSGRAEGTVRELILMTIPASEITMTPVRPDEQRSFASSTEAGEGGVEICARVDIEDVPRVEATLVRNGGLAAREGDYSPVRAERRQQASPPDIHH